jgi:hypothetical protein
MADKYFHGEITSDATDWGTGDASTDNKPCGGDAVQGYIKRKFTEKAGEFYYDQANGRYLVFSDSANRDLYLSDPETYASLLLGSFDAPSNYTAELYMTSQAQNTILKGKTGNYISFTFDIKTKTGASTGDAIVASFTFSSAGNTRTVTQIYNAGDEVRFLVDPYLADGRNTITVGITGRSTKASTTTVVIYTVVALNLTSTFDFSRPIQGGILSIPYTLEGSGTKYLEWYLNGVRLDVVDTVTELRVNTVKNIDISSFAGGIHNVQFRAYISYDGSDSYSETLYYDFVVASGSSNLTEILFGLTLAEPKMAEDAITISTMQFETVAYKVAVYDGYGRVLPMTIADNGTQVTSVSMTPNEVQELTYTPTSAGQHTLTFACGEDSVNIEIEAEESNIGISEVTDHLILKLSAKGRTNSETNPAAWTYGSVTTDFHGFTWDAQNGWHDDALVIPAGGYIDVNFLALTGNITGNGRTIEIDYETASVKDDNASVLSLINTSTNAGIDITASTALLRSSGGANVSTKFGSGEAVHLSFIINKTMGDDALLLFIVNNGVLERAAKYDANDQFAVNKTLRIGSDDCVVKLKSLRVYDKNLSVEEAFSNFAIDSPNLLEIADANDILTDGSIDADKVNSHIPIMIITGNIDYILSISDKARSKEYNPVPVKIEYRDMSDAKRNFTITDANIRLQGTSSISYPRKNFRIYSKTKYGNFNTQMTDGDGNVVEGGKWSFKDGAAPVTCWCLKADYAESSGSHNTGIAKLWNNLMYSAATGNTYPLRTNAQKWAVAHNYPYDVRTTIDGFPIVLFQHNSESEPLICLGQYNFNNDKSTEEVFGFTALENEGETFDNSKVQCFEFLDSDNELALFQTIENFDTKWSDAWESRYPDTSEPDLTALKTLATWLNACKENQEKWNEEKEAHFDLPKLAAYYVYLIRFGAVDQTVKNAMLETEDGVHWFFINYDNDTVLGIDNASVLFDTWDYDMQSRKGSGQDAAWYYAGGGRSVLWNCFEADPQCMAMVRTIDAALYSAGLRYARLNEVFDDEQTSKWCERIYNVNGRYKYIDAAEEGSNVLYMLQGRRQSHRHWWLRHRLEKYDNKWGNGTYTARLIQARASSGVQLPQGASYKFVPAIDSYFGYGLGSEEVESPTLRSADTEYTSAGLPQSIGVGTLVYIYNANNLKSIDVSDYVTALGTFNVQAAINEADGSTGLEEIILGDGEHDNVYLTDISGLQNMSSLKVLDIRGFKALNNLSGLASLKELSEFDASNSGLTSFVPAEGLSFTSLSLPSTLTTLGLVKASVETFNYTPSSTLLTLSLDSCTGIDVMSMLGTWRSSFTDYSNRNLSLKGVNWQNVDGDWLCDLAEAGWNDFEITGSAKLSGIDYDTYNRLVSVFGEACFNQDAVFHIVLDDAVYIMAPSEIVEGDTITLESLVFPPEDGTFAYYLVSSDSRVTLSGNQLSTRETGAASAAITIQGRFTPAGASQYTRMGNINITILQATYPTIAQTTLTETKVSDKEYHYALSFTNTFTGRLGTAWSFVSSNGMDEIVTITPSADGREATLTIGDLPSGKQIVSGNIRCTLTKNTGASIGTKDGSTLAVKADNIAITSADNPYLMALMYSKGLAANSTYMTKAECAAVTDSQLQMGTSSSTSIFYANTNFRNYCTHFDEFQYFTGLVNVPAYLFYNCKLQSITLPSQVMSIGTYAFYYCTLTSIVIPQGVISIDAYAFCYCNLRAISLPASVTSLGNNAFQGCPLKSLELPSGITSIPSYCFQSNHFTELPDLTNVTSIGASAFSSTSSTYTSINIPSNVTSIGSNAFAYSGATSITIWGAPSFGAYAFYQCSSLTSVTMPNVKSISDNMFSNCRALASITLPSVLTSIGSSAFFGTGLTSIVIPASVTSISTNPFQNCESLESIEVESGNTRYNSRDNCNAIINSSGNIVSGCKNSTFPTTVTGVKERAFYNIPITSVDLSRITMIEQYAFSGSSLTSVTVPAGITSSIDLGSYAFSKCLSLTHVTISCPNLGFGSSGQSVFRECSNLKTITFTSGVKSVSNSAFAYCTLLGTDGDIVIPSSMTNIGTDSFYNIGTNVVHVEATTPPSLGSKTTFTKNGGGTFTIYVPSASVSAYQSATNWKNYTIVGE